MRIDPTPVARRRCVEKTWRPEDVDACASILVRDGYVQALRAVIDSVHARHLVTLKPTPTQECVVAESVDYNHTHTAECFVDLPVCAICKGACRELPVLIEMLTQAEVEEVRGGSL